MRRLFTVLLLASFACLGLTAPSSAATVGLSVASKVKLVDGCKEVPIRYSVPSNSSWNLSVSITAPNGAIEDSDYLMDGIDLTSGTITTSVCAYSMKPGRYTITATYKGYDSDYNLVDTGSASRSFAVAKSKSKTKLKISKKRVRLNDVITIRSVSSAAGQRVEYGNVVVYLKRNSKKWKVWERAMTDNNGKWSTPGQAQFRGVAKFKVCTKASDYYSRSCSSVKKVRIR